MDQDSVPGPTSGISMDLGIFSKSQSRHFPKSNPRIFRDFLKPIHNCLLRVLTRAHNLGHDNRQLIQNIYQIKLRICQNIYYFRFFMLQKRLFFLSWYMNSWSLPLFAKFFGGPFLFNHLQSSLWVTSWLTLQYLAMLATSVFLQRAHRQSVSTAG